MPLCDACSDSLTRLPVAAPCAACGEDATTEIGFRYFICDACRPRVAGLPIRVNALGMVVPVPADPD
jgi:hypothetical protein